MDKGYLVKDCVIGPDHPDGKKGDAVSVESLTRPVFNKLVFNGAVVVEKPKAEKAKADK